ncbi:MAG TPA: response regulator [Longimicrobiaceae bacterium]|nr:response regulator [Longimicrobiaceae bacterium]
MTETVTDDEASSTGTGDLRGEKGVQGEIGRTEPHVEVRRRGAPGRPRVLLAEGDAITAAVIRHRFEREGFDVLHFATGDAAAAALSEVEPDVCMIELKLQGMEGLELLERIRGRPRERHVPVVILASMASEKIVERAFALGADDYVLKPFALTELMARVRRRLAVANAGP